MNELASWLGMGQTGAWPAGDAQRVTVWDLVHKIKADQASLNTNIANMNSNVGSMITAMKNAVLAAVTGMKADVQGPGNKTVQSVQDLINGHVVTQLDVFMELHERMQEQNNRLGALESALSYPEHTVTPYTGETNTALWASV